MSYNIQFCDNVSPKNPFWGENDNDNRGNMILFEMLQKLPYDLMNVHSVDITYNSLPPPHEGMSKLNFQ